MFAHYYGSKAKGWTLRVTDSNRPVGGTVYNVAGLREARKLAKELNAKPWNF